MGSLDFHINYPLVKTFFYRVYERSMTLYKPKHSDNLESNLNPEILRIQIPFRHRPIALVGKLPRPLP